MTACESTGTSISDTSNGVDVSISSSLDCNDSSSTIDTAGVIRDKNVVGNGDISSVGLPCVHEYCDKHHCTAGNSVFSNSSVEMNVSGVDSVFRGTDDTGSDDATPTRDENPVWRQLINDEDVLAAAGTAQVASSPSPVDMDMASDQEDDDMFYGPPVPGASSGLPLRVSEHTEDSLTAAEDLLTAPDSNANVFNTEEHDSYEEVGKSCSALPPSTVNMNTLERDSSADSYKSSNSTRQHSPPCSKSMKKKRKRSTSSSPFKKKSKKLKSHSRHRERSRSPKSPRRPRKLSVPYDKIREANGTALPRRTYDPLDPGGKRAVAHRSTSCDRSGGERRSMSKDQENILANDTNNNSGSRKEKTYHSSSSDHQHGSRSSRERTPMLDKSSHNSSSLNRDKRSSGRDMSSRDRTLSPDRLQSTKGIKSFSSSSSSRQTRLKTSYSTHRKRCTTKKAIDNSCTNPSSRMEVGTADGVGVQKMRTVQRKMFMATCVEEYYLHRNGSMAKGMKPLLAFKVGNPQFVSEFYDKKTEMNNQKAVRIDRWS